MKKLLALGVIAAAFTFAGCEFGPSESREDAHDTKDVDKSPPHVIAFNNKFPNVETKCDHGHRIYVTTKGHDRVDIVEDDPSCA
ncbi:MAG: hypothetical protein LC777_04785, partial [Actinobacteria bacterium]|nr:hypothetical protein [Actinomycetota bacterium]